MTPTAHRNDDSPQIREGLRDLVAQVADIDIDHIERGAAMAAQRAAKISAGTDARIAHQQTQDRAFRQAQTPF